MRFLEIVTTSRRVASTSSRLGKIELLAVSLRALSVDEVEIGVAFLAGTIRQRRLVLVMTGRAHLLVRGEPFGLRLLNRRDAPCRRLANPRIVLALRASESRDQKRRKHAEQCFHGA